MTAEREEELADLTVEGHTIAATRPRRYYNVTQHYRGVTCTLRPGPSDLGRMAGEPDFDRVYLAPTPEQCLIATGLGWSDADAVDATIYVYRTEPVAAYPAPADLIPDAPLTGEHWSVRPVPARLVFQFDGRDLVRLNPRLGSTLTAAAFRVALRRVGWGG